MPSVALKGRQNNSMHLCRSPRVNVTTHIDTGGWNAALLNALLLHVITVGTAITIVAGRATREHGPKDGDYEQGC